VPTARCRESLAAAKLPLPLRKRGRGEELPGQVLNLFGEWDDEDSLQRRDLRHVEAGIPRTERVSPGFVSEL
jgi:hypothetical protein